MRIMGLLKADKESEAGAPPSPELMQKMGKFIEEVMKAGVLRATDGLQPSSKGVRVTLSDGKFTVVDGPFAETKELIAGYAIIEAKSKEHAIELTKRFLEVVGEGQSEIRLMHEGPGCGGEATVESGEGEKRQPAEVGATR